MDSETCNLLILNLSFLNFGCPDLNVDPISENYYPTVFFNEFWLLRDKLMPINETVTELPLHLEVGPISMTKWQLFLQIDQSFQIHRTYGSMIEGEGDELKVCVFRNFQRCPLLFTVEYRHLVYYNEFTCFLNVEIISRFCMPSCLLVIIPLHHSLC